MQTLIPFLILLMALAACAAPEPATTDPPPASLPNPASVYCTQQGNRHEIRSAADGSQYGMCLFPDGGACDEWAYFRGECGPVTSTSPTPAATGETTSNDNGARGDNPGSFMPPGATEAIVDWWGVIKRAAPGAQFDDYFERQDLRQTITFGIDSRDPVVKAQIEALRDSGKIVHLYGTLASNVPDYNGSQIQVDRLEVEEPR